MRERPESEKMVRGSAWSGARRRSKAQQRCRCEDMMDHGLADPLREHRRRTRGIKHGKGIEGPFPHGPGSLMTGMRVV